MHRIARAVGVDYRRYNACNFACLRRAQNMTALGIVKVFDVGAHDGGYPGGGTSGFQQQPIGPILAGPSLEEPCYLSSVM